MNTRVDLLIKQVRHIDTNGTGRILRVIRARRNSDTIITAEQAKWLSDNNVSVTLKNDILDYYLTFPIEEDALAFKLTFGL